MRFCSTLRDPSRSGVNCVSELDLSDDATHEAVYPAVDELCSQLEDAGLSIDSVILEKEPWDKYTYNLTVHSNQVHGISRTTTSWVAYCHECKSLWEGPGRVAFARASAHPDNGCSFHIVAGVMES